VSAVRERTIRFLGSRAIRRQGWTLGVWLLLAVAVGFYALLIPSFGTFEIASIAKGGLGLAFLAIAQAIVVVSGGIDLSVGLMMVLVNCLSATLMEGQPFPTTLLIAVVVVAAAVVVDGAMGFVINATRVPDIVVTLAMSFVYGGLALWILPLPGGGTSPTFRFLFTGSEVGVGSFFVPAMVMVAVPTILVWLAVRRTRLGLTIYAAGSNREAAFLAGVDVARSKVVAYALAGGLAALAGLATTAVTGGGDARFTIGGNATLNSVAAIVLGGVALTGGVGSIVGAVAAAYVLFLLSPVLTVMGVDPNTSQVVQGVLIVLVVMVAGRVQLRPPAATSVAPTVAGEA
jgi:ribose transport system permease protein